MLSVLLFVATLLLLFWLLSLVWSRKVAQRVLKVLIYTGLFFSLIAATYIAYQSYRWGYLLHQINGRSLNTTEIINSASTGTEVKSN